MQVFVRAGAQHCLTLEDSATAAAVSRAVAELEGLPEELLYVVYNGRVLDAAAGSLRDCGVSALSTISVLPRIVGGAKHGKNRSANPVISYHERTVDMETQGYGTRKRRAGTASLLPFDCCCLSSQPPRNPVITPDGYLYDKECILENLIHQKQTIAKQMKEYEAQRRRWQALKAKEAADSQAKRTAEFVKRERSASTIGNYFESETKELSQAGKMLQMRKETVQTEDGKVVPKLPSFWLPSLTPGAKETEIKPPSTKTVCPMSGNPLKAKHLIKVNFTLADKHSTQALAAREERYICAITQKFLSNSVKCVVLKPSGHVITEEAYERLVKPDMLNPLTGDKLSTKDIIKMRSSGTGFSEKGAEIKKQKTAVMTMA